MRAGRPGAPDVLLDVNDLVVQFRTHDGTIHAVNGISFQLARGERLGLVGESGCGKSVTNLAIIRLLPKPAGRIERGSVLFDGVDLVTMDEADVREIRGRDIAMIFQDPMTSLNPVLTVEEQMTETIQRAPEDAQGRGPGPGGRAAGHGRHPAAGERASRASRTSSRAACASA